MPGISKTAKPDSAQRLEVLRAIVGEGGVRRGAPEDAVCGVVPELCVEPADESQLGRVLQYASEAELMVSPRGGGTKLEWGTAPQAIDFAISTARFNRILDYAPGDMTVTVGAGMSIAQLQSTLATHGQMLAMDPLWPERATVGGVIATNDSGALRVRYGGIRDLIIGATIVLADGTIATSGGKVVKNVAGYDLPKLMAGSLGTLGIITRAVFRLHPLPENSQTLTWSFADFQSAKDFVLAVADSTVVPSGVQMRTGGLVTANVTANVADDVGDDVGDNVADHTSRSGRSTHVDVRIDGIAAGIEAQMRAVRTLAGDVRPTEPEGDPWQMREQLWSKTLWSKEPGSDHGAANSVCIFKLSVLPTQLASIAEFAQASLDAFHWRLLMHSTGLGWLGVRVRQDNAMECGELAEFLLVLRGLLAPTGGSAVLLQAPVELREKVDVWGDPGSAFPLMVRINQQFDPRGILNRGRFVGGI